MHSTLPLPLRVLLWLSVAIWVAMEARQSLRQRPEATEEDRGSRPVLGVLLLVGMLAAFSVRRAVHSTTISPEAPAAWVGLVLLWCGTALRFWSFRTLGHYFTFTVQTSADQPVISDGPYRFVRHPSYLAILVNTAAFGLVIGNWLSLALLVIAVVAGLTYRIAVEERALARELGDRYQAYAASRKRLIPFVW